MSVDRKMAGKEARKKALIEQQRLRLEDLEEKEALDNARLLDGEDSDAEGEEGIKVPEGRDIESSGESDVEDAAQKSLFVNPLAKLSARNNQADGKESEEWSDDNLSDAAG